MSAVSCHYCKEEITSPSYIEFSTFAFHQEHFLCHGPCKESLVGVQFGEHEGNVYCATDYADLVAHTCDYCQEKITDSKVV